MVEKVKATETVETTIDTKKEAEKKVKVETEDMINELVENALEALEEMKLWDQEKTDYITHSIVMAGIDNHMSLAKLAVEETKRGVYEDKCIKNLFATENIWHSIKYQKTVDIIERDEQRGIVKVAQPKGVVCAITPVTNPTSTALFKSIISIKTRNPIIFAFHFNAQESSKKAAQIARDAAIKAGAPKNCIQWIEVPSIEATQRLMQHDGVSIILATGGNSLVKSAYSSGKPALGVGAGNAPAYLEKTCNPKRAVSDLVISKTFDNGMICASEQAAIVDEEIYEEVKKEFRKARAYIIEDKDIHKLEKAVLNEQLTSANPDIVGKDAKYIAEKAGIKVPDDTVVLIAELPDVGEKYPLSREKLSPVLAMIKAHGRADALNLCDKMLNLNGRGHTAALHTFPDNSDLIDEFGVRMDACRIIINSPTSIGGIGDLFNEMTPSLTLGCGSYGRNSISENVTAKHLLNIKTIAKRRNNMQWQKLPSKIYFERNSLNYLVKMQNVERAFIITDAGMVSAGLVNRVYDALNRRDNDVKIEMFSDVEPNPSTDTVFKGVEKMKTFNPDTIVALGGGSAIDAAKMMWLLYEHPDVNFEFAKQKFLDIRKRAYKIPEPGEKVKLVCIPSTSGTGAEVTPFAIITDSDNGMKYPITDYALTPTVAIVDPQFTYTLPKVMVADTGLDVLTHAIESYVSVMASDYTQGLSLKAIRLVYSYLPLSYHLGDQESREKMHNASTVAGMAFANAFLGVCHSIAHKIGAKWGIAHGRANAILLPHVIRYNAKSPTKRQVWAKYTCFTADEDYAAIAKMLGLEGNTTEELVESLARSIEILGRDMDVKMTLKENGVTKEMFLRDVDEIAELAYEDQCTTCNPKEPLISEIKEVLEMAFNGDGTID